VLFGGDSAAVIPFLPPLVLIFDQAKQLERALATRRTLLAEARSAAAPNPSLFTQRIK
jgi:hypothetical protein